MIDTKTLESQYSAMNYLAVILKQPFCNGRLSRLVDQFNFKSEMKKNLRIGPDKNLTGHRPTCYSAKSLFTRVTQQFEPVRRTELCKVGWVVYKLPFRLAQLGNNA
jgi:hypothetical protein